MPKYKIITHRRVHKFLSSLKDKNLKQTITNHITKLQDYPLSLREMDVEELPATPKVDSVYADF